MAQRGDVGKIDQPPTKHSVARPSRIWRYAKVLALGILALPVVYVLGALALMYLYFGGVVLVGLIAGATEAGLGQAGGGSIVLAIVLCVAVIGLCLATLYGIWIAGRRLIAALRE